MSVLHTHTSLAPSRGQNISVLHVWAPHDIVVLQKIVNWAPAALYLLEPREPVNVSAIFMKKTPMALQMVSIFSRA